MPICRNRSTKDGSLNPWSQDTPFEVLEALGGHGQQVNYDRPAMKSNKTGCPFWLGLMRKTSPRPSRTRTYAWYFAKRFKPLAVY